MSHRRLVSAIGAQRFVRQEYFLRGGLNIVRVVDRAVLLAIVVMVVCPSAFGVVWYVDKYNVGTEDGESWATAFNTIQEGVDAASADFIANGGSPEVWGAAGTYTDTSGPIVTMAENVHLYGGFDKAESVRVERDWSEKVTIIDGEDARRGILGANNATLDGFTITRGNAENGGGMYNEDSSPTVTNCTFSGNTSDGYGGGMFNLYSSPTVTNCSFSANSADGGGGGGKGCEGHTYDSKCSKLH